MNFIFEELLFIYIYIGKCDAVLLMDNELDRNYYKSSCNFKIKNIFQTNIQLIIRKQEK